MALCHPERRLVPLRGQAGVEEPVPSVAEGTLYCAKCVLGRGRSPLARVNAVFIAPKSFRIGEQSHRTFPFRESMKIFMKNPVTLFGLAAFVL